MYVYTYSQMYIRQKVAGARLQGIEGNASWLRGLQGYLAHHETPTPHDPPRTLGIGLQQGPRGVRFLLSEGLLQRGIGHGSSAKGSECTREEEQRATLQTRCNDSMEKPNLV